MPKLVNLHMGAFDHPDRVAALTDIVALHELVLIGVRHPTVDGRLAVLRPIGPRAVRTPRCRASRQASVAS